MGDGGWGGISNQKKKNTCLNINCMIPRFTRRKEEKKKTRTLSSKVEFDVQRPICKRGGGVPISALFLINPKSPPQMLAGRVG